MKMSALRPSLGRVLWQEEKQQDEFYLQHKEGLVAGEKLCVCPCQDQNAPQETGGPQLLGTNTRNN